MAAERSEAQKRADKAYYQRTKGRRLTIGASYTTEEAERLQSVFAAHGLSVGDVLRRAADRLERGEDL